MAEWLIEQGIGEERAIRLDNGRIVAARLRWSDELAAGLVEDARLVSRAAGSSRGTARLVSGEEVLVDKLPRSASEGAAIRLEVTRPALGEQGRSKLAHSRPTDAPPRPAPALAESLGGRVVPRFPGGDWDELVADALAGEVAFAGGSLVFSATPAMLLVDVDGALPPHQLARAAVAPLADALQRFDAGGSVGIDFPTLSARIDRQAVDTALADALAGWPHEKTAMNGFGFVQLVARLERPSLLHHAAFQRPRLAATTLLRRAERLDGAGAIELAGHPALAAHLGADRLTELARRTGREVRWRADPVLALAAPHAQLVPR